MKTWSAPRFTIARIMAWVAWSALLFAILKILFSPEILILLTIFAVAGCLVAIAIGINFGSEMAFGLRCPACRRSTLHRIARHPRYFRCSACRARFQRTVFGPWRDASGPKDASRFRKSEEALAWKDFHRQDVLEGTTSGSLLENKRRRDRSRPITRDCPTVKEDGSRGRAIAP